jgi:hypothetical protein
LCKKWCNMGIIELNTLNILQIYKVLDLASNNSQVINWFWKNLPNLT